eukprot:774868-Rhodomonas_salina.1
MQLDNDCTVTIAEEGCAVSHHADLIVLKDNFLRIWSDTKSGHVTYNQQFWCSTEEGHLFVGLGEPEPWAIGNGKLPIAKYESNRLKQGRMVTIKAVLTDPHNGFKMDAHILPFAYPSLVDLLPIVSSKAFEVAGMMAPNKLPRLAQKLYDNVKDQSLRELSKAIDLKMDLGDLIHQSLTTKGCILYGMLDDKKNLAREAGMNPKQTYLRIAYGTPNAQAPGHPFILEVWPPGHSSPVHDHAGTFSAIKVLKGTLRNSQFAMLSDLPHHHAQKKIATTTLKEGDITWIHPFRFQIHQVKNVGAQTAISFHTYEYPDQNVKTMKGFDYIHPNGKHVTGASPVCDCGMYMLGVTNNELTT